MTRALRGEPLGFLCVIGHTNIDLLATVERLPRPDESTAFDGPVRALGGTAANIAVSAAALGAPTSLASFVGADFPAAFLRALRRHGVDTRAVVKVRGAPTPVCWIFSDRSERQMAFINQGAAASAAARPLPRSAIERAQVVHLATGDPAFQTRAAALAARLGKTVAFDPAQELGYLWDARALRAMLGHTDTLFLNDAERHLARRYLKADRDRGLLRFVPELVLTHGRRGAEYLSEAEHVRCAIVRPRRIVNTVGAGDAFRGGYYAALYRGFDARARLRWGAAAASFAVETPGGQDRPPTAPQLERRLASRA